MTGAVQASAGILSVPDASWLKFVTLGNNGTEYGFQAGVIGSISLTNRVGGRVATRFLYDYSIPLPGEFNFEIDETNTAGFDFTRLLVEDFTGSLITLLKADAVEYSGFPIKGWVWSSIPGGGPLWTLASVGTAKKIYIQR
jgi:hypothetical protein